MRFMVLRIDRLPCVPVDPSLYLGQRDQYELTAEDHPELRLDAALEVVDAHAE
jgi:hypothetical protein